MDYENNGGSMDSANGGNKKQKTDKVWKIVVAILSVVVIALGGVLAWKLIDGSNCDVSDDSSAAAEGEESKKEEVVVPVGWKTLTTEDLGLSFDYPENWTISETLIDDYGSLGHETIIKSPMGLKLVLSEMSEIGIGGDCGENPFMGFFKKEAAVSSLDGYDVVATSLPAYDDSGADRFELSVGKIDDLGGGRAVRCSQSIFFNIIQDFSDSSGKDYVVTFLGAWDEITSVDEYNQAVKILSSLRLE